MNKWWLSLRPYSFTASLIPLLLGTVLAGNVGSLDPLGIILTYSAGLTYHIIANVFNSYYDWENECDQPGDDQVVPVLIDPTLGAKALYRAGMLFLGIGVLLTLILGRLYGLTIFIIAVSGLATAYFYTAPPIAYKYRGWSLPAVFISMGVLLTASVYIVQTASWDWRVTWLSLPISFLVAAILHGNEMRDYHGDLSYGSNSLVIATGIPIGVVIYRSLVLIPYILVLCSVVLGILSPLSLIVFLSIRGSLALIALVNQKRFGPIVVSTAKLHAQFGLLYVISLLIT